ncbi:hypothetical protein [Streptomyces sp. A5-4]|uniref:hypothetical protein n=1 Tax=Streptomyces sp. A5-4 TaxID=3384771 RepID=UPI003DA8A35D
MAQAQEPAPSVQKVASTSVSKLPRCETATPDRLWRHFLDATGTLHVAEHAVTCALNLRTHHPVLIEAGFADLETPTPWWNDRTLRFRFPPR